MYFSFEYIIYYIKDIIKRGIMFKYIHTDGVGQEFARKTSFNVNICLAGFHFIMMLLFLHYNVLPLFFINIISVIVYLLGFILIKKLMLTHYLWLCYIEICLYMCFATICLGYQYGFLFYTMSMLPILFYADYLGYKMGSSSTHANVLSIICILSFFISSAWCIFIGPLYTINTSVESAFLFLNAAIVFVFILSYMNIFLTLIIGYEKTLQYEADTDKLTCLNNRAGLLRNIDNIINDCTAHTHWLMMIDIDDFKLVNDTYGHMYGDYVLKKLADILKSECSNEYICRWGGEEFIIIGETEGKTIDEQLNTVNHLRNIIAMTDFTNGGTGTNNITITGGITFRRSSDSYDEWIDRADKRLYYGKTHGKNCIVYHPEA